MLLSDGGRCCRCAAGGGRWFCGRCRFHRPRPAAGACARYKDSRSADRSHPISPRQRRAPSRCA
nr:MAG TPA: hypothetical protein [Caudoviricetes sp.]DAZ13463.1 MAG TPA: hypothetical protein [Caudoviricetes sp.]